MGKENKVIYELINRNRGRYISILKSFFQYKKDIEKITYGDSELNVSSFPCWNQSRFSGLDVIALWYMIATYKPHKYLEIGSGYSTLFANEVIEKNKLDTQIISIDSRPWIDIDAVCNFVYRIPLQEVIEIEGTRVFEGLEKNDILFLDGSHIDTPNSDVDIFFSQILPKVKSGVIIQIHDIFSPYDYPNNELFRDKGYNEQYRLEEYLLRNKVDILLPNCFIDSNKRLNNIITPIWKNIKTNQKSGGSFWFKKI